MKVLQNSLLTRTLAEMVGGTYCRVSITFSVSCSWSSCLPLPSPLCQGQGSWTPSSLWFLPCRLQLAAAPVPLSQSACHRCSVKV